MTSTGPRRRARVRGGWRRAPYVALALLCGSAQASEAWLSAERAHIRLLPDATSPIIGVLERGDRVEVADDPDTPEGWTLLRPLGSVRTGLLAPIEPTRSEPLEYVYGKVIVRRAGVRRTPDGDAPVLAHHKRGQILAFRPFADPTGKWLERPDGTFVPRAMVKLLAGSAFQGVHDPPPRLAFLLRRQRIRPRGTPGAAKVILDRRTAVAVTEVGDSVETERGSLPRDSVRLAQARPRPAGVGPAEKWIHVDTLEQVLTAYEGDRLVFATLVSTGREHWETPTGHFRVWLKLRHGEMRGHRAAYLVEEVPDALFFGGETALHGAIWHDRFGTAVSHGCINLSPADAAWLFRWAPPELPERWHGILPGAAGLPTLWVIIEHGSGETPSARAPTGEPLMPSMKPPVL